MNSFIKSIFGFFFCGLFSVLQGQIKTLQLFNPQTNDLTPVIRMDESLIFSFDDLYSSYKNYQYKIVRYNMDWEPSNAFEMDYLRGFSRNTFTQYSNSFNTLVGYTHYQTTIPNNNTQIILSGNYGIQLIAPNSEEVIAEKRFCVAEDIATVGLNITKIPDDLKKNQRISALVYSQNIDFSKPTKQKLVLVKNNNWQQSISQEQPVFTQHNQLTFSQLDNEFYGGYEFNYFDTKNISTPSLTTEEIIKDSIYITMLLPNSYTTNIYTDMPDIDGDYYIRNMLFTGTEFSNNDADYTEVDFALADYTPGENEQVFVYGAFNNFNPTPDSILHFDPDSQLWRTSILLKQGYYNYSYAIYNTQSKEIDYTSITGNYWQTENKYSGFYYYRPWGSNYDLLVGYGEAFSRPSLR